MQDELALVKKAVRGDTPALSELLRRHYSFLYQYALKLTLSKTRAEDVTQETMLKAIEKIGTYESKAKFSSWLIAIATRLVIDGHRRSKREQRWLHEEQSIRALQYETIQRMNDWPAVLHAIGQLTEALRAPLLLKHYYGYTQDEIAEILDIPSGTVKSRLHTGLKLLRKELAVHEEG